MRSKTDLESPSVRTEGGKSIVNVNWTIQLDQKQFLHRIGAEHHRLALAFDHDLREL